MKRVLLICCLALWQLSAFGCQSLKLWGDKSELDDDDEGPLKTTYIGDQVNIAGLHPITVEAVGLVVGLDNTGEDKPPSAYRTMLLEDMKRRKEPNPNAVLRSTKTALVLVRAAIPPVIGYGETFDVEVVLPEGSNSTSLAGGYLREVDLAERFAEGGRIQRGHVLAKCKGPVMVSTGEGPQASQAALLKRGKILGGAAYVGGILREKRKVGLYLRNDFKSTRQTERVAGRISNRFHHHDKGIKVGMAKAKTDQHIELDVHPRYKENYFRYLQVIRRIALNETPIQQRRRVEKLRRDLLNPDRAGIASLELEAIGKDGIPILKEGLQSPISEVQFYAADALAYLDDPSGVEILTRMAREEPAFRVFALAALTNLDGVANDPLKNMLSDQSAEVRYGAFHALKSIDKHHPFLARERIGDQCNMYLLRSKGDPMVHLTKHRQSEIVLFGTEQRLQPPFYLQAGQHIRVSAQAGTDNVSITRFEAGKRPQERVVRTYLADVIRTIGEMGGTYPDIAQLLTQAKSSTCLEARLEFDALPQGGRIYHRPLDVASGSKSPSTQTEVGSAAGAPNLFPNVNEQPPTTLPEQNPLTTPADQEAQPDDRVAAAETNGETPKREEEKPGFFARLFPQRSAADGKPRPSKPANTANSNKLTESISAPYPGLQSGQESGGTKPRTASNNRDASSGKPAAGSERTPTPENDSEQSEPAAEASSTRSSNSTRSGSGNSRAARGTADAGATDPFSEVP